MGYSDKKYDNSDWLPKIHIENLRVKGVALDTETKKFIFDFYNTSKESGGKIIFYETVFLLKRNFLPKTIVYWYIVYKTKKAFRQNANAKALIGLEKNFAIITLHDAIKRYCREQ